MPTERFRFQSNYFKKFEMSGSAGYSTSDYNFSDLSEVVNGFTARTAQRGSTAGGPIKTKRVSVNADWSGVYSIMTNSGSLILSGMTTGASPANGTRSKPISSEPPHRHRVLSACCSPPGRLTRRTVRPLPTIRRIARNTPPAPAPM